MKQFKGSYKEEFCNLFRRWKFLIEGEISIQGIIIILVFHCSYYFNLVYLVNQFYFPSIPKKEIIENRLKKTIKKGDC